MKARRTATRAFVAIPVILAALGAAATYASGVTTVFQYDPAGNLTRVIDVSSDVSNCGGVAVACSPGNACCVGECANLTSSVNNCGACGWVCSGAYPNTVGTCGAGVTPLWASTGDVTAAVRLVCREVWIKAPGEPGEYIQVCTGGTPAVRFAPEASAALVLVVEGGSADANATNLQALKANLPPELVPYFRTLHGDVVAGYLSKLLQDGGKKYGRIYLVRSSTESKSLLLGTLVQATALHAKVDLILAIHGSPSNWSFSPDLNTLLWGDELVAWASANMTLGMRNKVRAVFSTACYSDTPASPFLLSMTGAIVTAFPAALTYGSAGVNWVPIHRDFHAFERWYGGDSVSGAVSIANWSVRNNVISNQPRSQARLPTVLGTGCAQLVDFLGISYTRCEDQTISLGSLGTTPYMLEGSVGRVAVGASANADARISTF
jgi:Stigma-specific protein, Stig1